MTLTRNERGTAKARMALDPVFREALIEEGIKAMLKGDVAAGRDILRDMINDTETQ